MPKPKTEAAQYKTTVLRLPPELFALLKQQQKEMGRTFNGHVLHVLRYGLGIEKRQPVPPEYTHENLTPALAGAEEPAYAS